jgi:phospholipid/cholesterol/gamma-HCH transport system permease protein
MESLGSYAITLCTELGKFTIFVAEVVRVLCTTRPKVRQTVTQMYSIGVQSLSIAVLTGTFAGMVFALQSYVGFSRFGGEQFIGLVVALGIIRELGPVMTGLMVTGRAGSAIAAEIATMRVTEQIDALDTLGINIYQYLIIPRILGGTLIFPFLTLFSMICGIVGGYGISVGVLSLSGEDYITSITSYVEFYDILGGLIKAFVFGFILTLIGTYKGYTTEGGARGVGRATTQSVVTSSVLILIFNYIVTQMLELL